MDMPLPPWKQAPRARPVRRQLSREAIVDTAMAILDKEGLDAVSMRRIAQDLETGPASLYAHVGNKDELLELVIDRVAGEMPLPVPDPEHWQEQARQMIKDAINTFVKHPGVAQVAMAGVPSGPNSLRSMEATLAVLKAGGLHNQAVAWAGDLFGSFIPSTALEHALFQAGGKTSEQVKEYFVQFGHFLRSLPAQEYPTVSALADEMVSGEGDERLDFKIDVLLAGLVAVSDRMKAQDRATAAR